MSINIETKRKFPKEIWIIFDDQDGPHIFKTKKEAYKTYKKWERECHKSYIQDSFFNMSEPTKYILSEK